ncbi:MAG: site-2 protease family protein [Candidatus Berkelbacteria bacterium]|nr:site-2 protease family protein [Candidatus Berkelbacteria bacterium]
MFLLNLLSQPVFAIAALVGLILAITVHEFAHAWAANRLGDPTAKHLGRLTLNPFKHLDPLGTLFLLVAGFGWGKPVPYNPSNLKSDADEVKVALAGVSANLIFALILGIPLRIATMNHVAIDSNLWLTAIELVLEMNLVLIAFNIIPIPPLDGSKVIFQFISFDARIAYERYGPIILFALIIASNVFGFPFLVRFMEPIIRVLSFVTKGTYTAIF